MNFAELWALYEAENRAAAEAYREKFCPECRMVLTPYADWGRCHECRKSIPLSRWRRAA